MNDFERAIRALYAAGYTVSFRPSSFNPKHREYAAPSVDTFIGTAKMALADPVGIWVDQTAPQVGEAIPAARSADALRPNPEQVAALERIALLGRRASAPKNDTRPDESRVRVLSWERIPPVHTPET